MWCAVSLDFAWNIIRQNRVPNAVKPGHSADPVSAVT